MTVFFIRSDLQRLMIQSQLIRIHLQLLQKKFQSFKKTGYPESQRIGFIPIWNWMRDSLKSEHLKSEDKLKGSFLS